MNTWLRKLELLNRKTRKEEVAMRFTRMIMFSVVLIGVSAGVRHETHVSAPDRAWISSVLSYDAAICNKECAQCGQPGDWLHVVTDALPGEGEYSSPWHKCHDRHVGCFGAVHHCARDALAKGDRDTLIRLIQTMPADELLAVDATEPNILVNWKRQAVQILGCGGTVVASLAWTPTQASGLEALVAATSTTQP